MSQSEDQLGEEIRRLRLEEGDILVFRTKQHLSREQKEYASAMLAKIAGPYPALILDGGASLEILSKADQAA